MRLLILALIIGALLVIYLGPAQVDRHFKGGSDDNVGTDTPTLRGDGASGPPGGVVVDALSTPLPTPLVPDVPGATAPAEASEPTLWPANPSDDTGVAAGVTDGGGGAGTLVSGVQLTVYSCENDSTGRYCPDGQAMYSGQQVHRGAIACGWQWDIGQRLRIIGDPYPNMVYTCLDRGGAVTGIDVWFYDYHAPATQAWRAALPGTITVELLD